ncbi:nonsense-mediated mRNA decay factor SMG5 isoform X1 [Schistocerca nitens]|uniref:nonsense-mediated mRNA decay factor SMG5 isoform X1 n=2 Tax=Schistocerca nitens TaxID=7011 RepID=UPI002117AEF3|nr:nonsense-mediated mRNA decay factor SMG5 isoform X1 [Schistocerca nitens]
MKKSYNAGSDVKNESADVIKRLYRTVTEVARQLDDGRSLAEEVGDLFTSSLLLKQSRLKELCERIIFAQPLQYGRKTEELLWRKGFYEVITSAKKLTPKEKWSPSDRAKILMHLSSATGYYLHVLFRLQVDYDMDLRSIVDFPAILDNTLHLQGTMSPPPEITAEAKEWARQAAHRCLVYLGDLSRYSTELEPWHLHLELPSRYYLQALMVLPGNGMPHNQLGTVAGTRNYCVDAAYHYMRSITSEQPFDGADGNLRRIFDRNSKWLEAQANCIPSGEPSSNDIVHQFVSRFLLLVDIWFYNKNSVPDIHQLCHQTLVDLQACLSQQSPDGESCTSAEEGEEDEKNETPDKRNNPREDQQQQNHLSETIIFQLVAMLLICVSRLQVNDSQTLCGNLVAFTLAVFSQLVEQVAVHIKESVFSLPLAMAGNQQLPSSQAQENGDVQPASRKSGYSRHIAKLRRRRRRLPLNSEDSDLSDGGEFFYPLSSSSDEANSEGEEPIVLSSEEEEDESDETSSSTQVGTIEAKVNGLPQTQEQCLGKPGNVSLHSDVTNEKHLQKNEQNNNNNKLDDKKVSAEQPSATTGQQLQNGVGEGIGSGVTERALEPADVLELMVGEGRLLEAVQVLADWLKSESNVETLQACGKTRPRTLLTRLVTLLNLLRIDPVRLSAEREVLRGAQDLYLKVPLPEDMQLRGLGALKEAHGALDWDYFRWHSISPKQASLLRAYKLASFGRYLATIPETGVSYDSASGLLRISAAEDINEEGEQPDVEEGVDVNNVTEAGEGDGEQDGGGGSGGRGQQLMKQMGRLWLKAEVRELETRVRRLGRGPRLSPYLAVDSAALTHHLPKVRHLVAARRFIVLVPAIVVQALDEMKREVSRAREAIRWLEAQFQRGNRFLRAQRLHERLSLPLIKYPRRKEREAWLFFQVVECCHYFSKQAAAAGGTGDSGPEQAPLVTLLTGVPLDEPATYSPRGVAETAGINIESIATFYAKWRASNKVQR